MEDKKTRIVCIHGFNGKANGLTYRTLKKMIPDAEYFAEQYDLLDVDAVVKRIEELKPDVLACNSLGCFYALNYKGPCKKILVNPCLVPTVEIPKLDSTVSKDVLDKWNQMEIEVLSSKYPDIFGIFAKDDELFHYKDIFDCMTDGQHSIMVEGTHILKNPGLTEGLSKAIESLKLQV